MVLFAHVKGPCHHPVIAMSRRVSDAVTISLARASSSWPGCLERGDRPGKRATCKIPRAKP